MEWDPRCVLYTHRPIPPVIHIVPFNVPEDALKRAPTEVGGETADVQEEDKSRQEDRNDAEFDATDPANLHRITEKFRLTTFKASTNLPGAATTEDQQNEEEAALEDDNDDEDDEEDGDSEEDGEEDIEGAPEEEALEASGEEVLVGKRSGSGKRKKGRTAKPAAPEEAASGQPLFGISGDDSRGGKAAAAAGYADGLDPNRRFATALHPQIESSIFRTLEMHSLGHMRGVQELTPNTTATAATGTAAGEQHAAGAGDNSTSQQQQQTIGKGANTLPNAKYRDLLLTHLNDQRRQRALHRATQRDIVAHNVHIRYLIGVSYFDARRCCDVSNSNTSTCCSDSAAPRKLPQPTVYENTTGKCMLRFPHLLLNPIGHHFVTPLLAKCGCAAAAAAAVVGSEQQAATTTTTTATNCAHTDQDSAASAPSSLGHAAHIIRELVNAKEKQLRQQQQEESSSDGAAAAASQPQPQPSGISMQRHYVRITGSIRCAHGKSLLKFSYKPAVEPRPKTQQQKQQHQSVPQNSSSSNNENPFAEWLTTTTSSTSSSSSLPAQNKMNTDSQPNREQQQEQQQEQQNRSSPSSRVRLRLFQRPELYVAVQRVNALYDLVLQDVVSAPIATEAAWRRHFVFRSIREDGVLLSPETIRDTLGSMFDDWIDLCRAHEGVDVLDEEACFFAIPPELQGDGQEHLSSHQQLDTSAFPSLLHGTNLCFPGLPQKQLPKEERDRFVAKYAEFLRVLEFIDVEYNSEFAIPASRDTTLVATNCRRVWNPAYKPFSVKRGNAKSTTTDASQRRDERAAAAAAASSSDADTTVSSSNNDGKCVAQSPLKQHPLDPDNAIVVHGERLKKPGVYDRFTSFELKPIVRITDDDINNAKDLFALHIRRSLRQVLSALQSVAPVVMQHPPPPNISNVLPETAHIVKGRTGLIQTAGTGRLTLRLPPSLKASIMYNPWNEATQILPALTPFSVPLLSPAAATSGTASDEVVYRARAVFPVVLPPARSFGNGYFLESEPLDARDASLAVFCGEVFSRMHKQLHFAIQFQQRPGNVSTLAVVLGLVTIRSPHVPSARCFSCRHLPTHIAARFDELMIGGGVTAAAASAAVEGGQEQQEAKRRIVAGAGDQSQAVKGEAIDNASGEYRYAIVSLFVPSIGSIRQFRVPFAGSGRWRKVLSSEVKVYAPTVPLAQVEILRPARDCDALIMCRSYSLVDAASDNSGLSVSQLELRKAIEAAETLTIGRSATPEEEEEIVDVESSASAAGVRKREEQVIQVMKIVRYHVAWREVVDPAFTNQSLILKRISKRTVIEQAGDSVMLESVIGKSGRTSSFSRSTATSRCVDAFSFDDSEYIQEGCDVAEEEDVDANSLLEDEEFAEGTGAGPGMMVEQRQQQVEAANRRFRVSRRSVGNNISNLHISQTFFTIEHARLCKDIPNFTSTVGLARHLTYAEHVVPEEGGFQLRRMLNFLEVALDAAPSRATALLSPFFGLAPPQLERHNEAALDADLCLPKLSTAALFPVQQKPEDAIELSVGGERDKRGKAKKQGDTNKTSSLTLRSVVGLHGPLFLQRASSTTVTPSNHRHLPLISCSAATFGRIPSNITILQRNAQPMFGKEYALVGYRPPRTFSSSEPSANSFFDPQLRRRFARLLQDVSMQEEGLTERNNHKKNNSHVSSWDFDDVTATTQDATVNSNGEEKERKRQLCLRASMCLLNASDPSCFSPIDRAKYGTAVAMPAASAAAASSTSPVGGPSLNLYPANKALVAALLGQLKTFVCEESSELRKNYALLALIPKKTDRHRRHSYFVASWSVTVDDNEDGSAANNNSTLPLDDSVPIAISRVHPNLALAGINVQRAPSSQRLNAADDRFVSSPDLLLDVAEQMLPEASAVYEELRSALVEYTLTAAVTGNHGVGASLSSPYEEDETTTTSGGGGEIIRILSMQQVLESRFKDPTTTTTTNPVGDVELVVRKIMETSSTATKGEAEKESVSVSFELLRSFNEEAEGERDASETDRILSCRDASDAFLDFVLTTLRRVEEQHDEQTEGTAPSNNVVVDDALGSSLAQRSYEPRPTFFFPTLHWLLEEAAMRGLSGPSRRTITHHIHSKIVSNLNQHGVFEISDVLPVLKRRTAASVGDVHWGPRAAECGADAADTFAETRALFEHSAMVPTPICDGVFFSSSARPLVNATSASSPFPADNLCFTFTQGPKILARKTVLLGNGIVGSLVCLPFTLNATQQFPISAASSPQHHRITPSASRWSIMQQASVVLVFPFDADVVHQLRTHPQFQDAERFVCEKQELVVTRAPGHYTEGLVVCPYCPVNVPMRTIWDGAVMVAAGNTETSTLPARRGMKKKTTLSLEFGSFKRLLPPHAGSSSHQQQQLPEESAEFSRGVADHVALPLFHKNMLVGFTLPPRKPQPIVLMQALRRLFRPL